MNIIENALSFLGFKKKQDYDFSKCCGGGCHKDDPVHVVMIGEYEPAPIEPVEYNEISKVRFSREDKKISRLREYFNSPETDKE